MIGRLQMWLQMRDERLLLRLGNLLSDVRFYWYRIRTGKWDRP